MVKNSNCRRTFRAWKSRTAKWWPPTNKVPAMIGWRHLRFSCAVAQNLFGMLSQQWRGQPITCRCVRKPDRIGYAANFPKRRMFNLYDQASGQGLWVTQCFGHRINRRGGNAGVGKLLQPRLSRLQVKARLQNRQQVRTMFDSQRIADDARIPAE